jgi:hypothetical protein
MELKSIVLWIVAVIAGVGTLLDSLKKIRDGVPLIREHRLPILGAALFLAGASAGMLWEMRVSNQKQRDLNDAQNSNYNLEQKYEALKEMSDCKRPNAPQVILYEDAQFKGRRLCFTPGAYGDLRDYAFNDVTSSISLRGNVKAFMYKDIGFEPRAIPIAGDIDALRPDLNDTISSLKVCKRDDPCN